MEVVLSILVGGLYAAGVYMLLRRSIVRLLVGLVLLGHAANLLIFTAAGLTRARPPLIPDDANVLTPPYADPLPQALILTAIVIGFGVLAFAIVLIYRVYHSLGVDDLDEMRTTER